MPPTMESRGTEAAARKAVVAGKLDAAEHTGKACKIKSGRATYKAQKAWHARNPWAAPAQAAARAAEKKNLIKRPSAPPRSRAAGARQ